MQHMADNIFIHAANLTLLRRDSYLEHLKPGVKQDTWCALRNQPLQHTAVFPNVVIAKVEEDIAKTEADFCFPNLIRVQAGAAAVATASNLTRLIGRVAGIGSRNRTNQETDQFQDMPAWLNFENRFNFTCGRSRGSSSVKRGSFRGKNKPSK